MRIITGILFTIGIFFAVFGWALIPTPVGIFMPEYEYKTYDIISSLSGSLASLIGYYIWIGWAYFTFKGKYFLLTKRKFWFVSLLQHSAWLFVFPYIRKETVWVYLGASEMVLWNIWILGNILIALLGIIIPLGHQNEKAEPDSIHNSVGCAYSV